MKNEFIGLMVNVSVGTGRHSVEFPKFGVTMIQSLQRSLQALFLMNFRYYMMNIIL
jgi:hypothetical protein